jgi:NIPSNAP protein
MIYELRTYTVQPGKLGDYLKLSSEVGRKIRGDRYGTFEGSWSTEFGLLNQYVHLWSFPSLDERERLRGALGKNEEWTKGYVPQIRSMLVAQQNKILSAVTEIKPPTDTGNVYELRTYRAHVGKLGEWLELTRGIIPTREKYSRIVGYWQTEVSQLNEAVHLWVYKDLNERAAVRARVLQDPAWQTFLSKAMPLLQQQEAVVLTPTPFSPMK